MTLFPELERQLAHAADRRIAHPRGVRRRRLGVPIIVAAALAVAGTAAATDAWKPIFGPDDDRASVSPQRAPAEQAGAIEVLRRPQSDQDRGPEIQATIGLVRGSLNQGIYTETLHRVGTTAGGKAIVVFAAARSSDDEGNLVLEAPICIGYPGQMGAIATPCFRPEAIAANHFSNVMSDERGLAHVFGLVPDGVASVTLTARDGSTVHQRVRNNFYDFGNPPPPGRDLTTGRISWQAEDGSLIEPVG